MKKKHAFRIWENATKKKVNTEQHLLFNKQCIQHSLLPTYTNVRLHDADASSQPFVSRFRVNLIEYQIKNQERCIVELRKCAQEAKEAMRRLVSSNLRYNAFHTFLERLEEQQVLTLTLKHNKKLCMLYDGDVPPYSDNAKILNLSNQHIDDDICNILQLGMNCDLKTKTNRLTTKIELEKLYYNIKQKEKSKEITIENDEQLRCDLKRIGLRHTIDYNKDVLTKEQYQKVKEFRNNENIIVRKADKSNTFVIMNRKDYISKLHALLDNRQKFQKVRKDTVDNLKSEINDYITILNTRHSQNIALLEGHFEAGYLYGNPKIHKDSKNPPLRPIISQIGTPVYNIAKLLNSIIVKYMPQKYAISSTHAFLELIRSNEQPPKFLASLDVESLFTNVPVMDTIEIILNNVYNHATSTPPAIPKAILRQLLIICTTKCPFRNFDGQLFIQKDGVSMGSPLGPTFASYYMCNLENKAFTELTTKPPIYCRYIDDCMLGINNINELHNLKSYFEENSILNFTYEIETNKKLAFLDVLLHRRNDHVDTTVFTKTTNTGECLNFQSLCPLKYKISVIKTFLHRSYAINSNWSLFHADLQRIRQILVNNGFPISMIDKQVAIFLDKKFTPNLVQCSDNITLFYRNQYNSQANADEKYISTVIHKYLKPAQQHKKINVQIYYKNKKLKSLFITNKHHNSDAGDHVVYEYRCKESSCNAATYIGYTTCSLAKRFYYHNQSGSIFHHNRRVHNCKPGSKQLRECTTILYRNSNKQDLLIAEALLIKENKPSLNEQDEGQQRILQIF